jgi:threonine synthase
MKLYSTNNPLNIVSLKEAVLNAFPKDKGLYLPTHIPQLEKEFFETLHQKSFIEICEAVSHMLFKEALSVAEIDLLVSRSINFPAPLVNIDKNIAALELFHGPTMAFKDFGARYMAQLMSLFLKDQNRKTTILVATSGDTGGAVASGFFEIENIEVIILYPSGKVSPLQEKQLTGWGKNIMAIEVDGVFDDCQALVKQAFIDETLQGKYSFSSANSINIARLIPQSFYYFEGYKQLENKDKPVIFSVPSGNFGNLTAGVLAMKMGLPAKHLIAAINANETFYDYIQTGQYRARPSVPTISNAMDVGDPSNFARLHHLFGSTWNRIKDNISCYSYSDQQTKQAIKSLFNNYGYIADPHGALAYRACRDHQKTSPNENNYIFLETAHPAKFLESVEPLINQSIKLPAQLARFQQTSKHSIRCKNNYLDFKNILLEI